MGGGGGRVGVKTPKGPQLLCLNYLPISGSFGVKIVMHYVTFLLIKTS